MVSDEAIQHHSRAATASGQYDEVLGDLQRFLGRA